jgi:hypothetical protein
MLRAILVLAAIGVTIYALVDCLRVDAAELRGLPRPVWVLFILLLAPIGAVIWLIVTRQPIQRTPTSRPPVVAPDDDADFLRSLEHGPHPDGTDQDPK